MKALGRVWKEARGKLGTVIGKNLAVVVPAAALLVLLPMLIPSYPLITLVKNVLLRPLMCAVAAAAITMRWEGRKKWLPRIKRNALTLFVTGLLAWAAARGIALMLEVLPLLLGLADALLGWVPVLGSGLRVISNAVRTAVSALTTFLIYGVTVLFMLPVVGDGNRGKEQARQALRWVWGGRPDVFWALGILAVLWVVCWFLCQWISALLFGSVLAVPILICALCCTFLTERDRQEGVRLRIYEEE